MITGYLTTQLVYVAAKLGIADLLSDGPKTAEKLAARTGANADRLYRVLHAFASIGTFEERTLAPSRSRQCRSRCTAITPNRSDPWAVFLVMESCPAWGELLYGVMTGATQVEKCSACRASSTSSKVPRQAPPSTTP